MNKMDRDPPFEKRMKNRARLIKRLIRKTPGVLMEFRFRFTEKPFIFTDWLGNRYWRFRGDQIRRDFGFRSTTFSVNVVKYLLRHVHPGMVGIDIGANIGAISIPLWQAVSPAGKVISVEADPNNISRLIDNLNLNQCPTEFIKNAAIADKNGVVPLVVFENLNGAQTIGHPSGLETQKHYLIEVPALTFENLVHEYDLDRIDFVKVDVEGAEVLVLPGMRSFLENEKIDQVIFEVNYQSVKDFGKTVDELMSIWNDLPYDLFMLDEDGITYPIAPPWPEKIIWDCLAVLKSPH